MAKQSILQSLRRIGDVFIETVAIDATSATNYIYNAACPCKLRVIDFWIVNTSGDGGAATATLTDGTHDISDALSTDNADKTVTRAGTLDDAYCDLDPGDSLVVKLSKTGEDTIIAYVMLMVLA